MVLCTNKSWISSRRETGVLGVGKAESAETCNDPHSTALRRFTMSWPLGGDQSQPSLAVDNSLVPGFLSNHSQLRAANPYIYIDPTGPILLTWP